MLLGGGGGGGDGDTLVLSRTSENIRSPQRIKDGLTTVHKYTSHERALSNT